MLSFHFNIDINECELGIGICPTDKECKNIPGGYDCVDSKKNSMYVNVRLLYQARCFNDTITFFV